MALRAAAEESSIVYSVCKLSMNRPTGCWNPILAMSQGTFCDEDTFVLVMKGEGESECMCSGFQSETDCRILRQPREGFFVPF